MSFQTGGPLDGSVGAGSGVRSYEQASQMESHGAVADMPAHRMMYGGNGMPAAGALFPGTGGFKSENARPPTPASSAGSEGSGSHDHHARQQQQHSFQLPIHTAPMQMPVQNIQPSLQAPPPAAPPAPAEEAEQPPAEEQEAVEDHQPKRARRTKERIRRIHLPVREGMDELSSSEGSGSEWDEPVLAEGAPRLPPGYSGKRRVKKPADGKIKPAYYYPTEGSTRGVPVFEPTYEEFKDFNSFINKIDNYGMRSGIVKVVPPKEWHDSLVSVSEPLKDTVIRDAIEQNFMGSAGLFKQSNIASRRLYNVKQWKELCESDKYATPDFFKANAEKEKQAREEKANAAPKRPAKGAATRAAKRAKEAEARAARTATSTSKEDTPSVVSVTSEAPTMQDHEAMKDQPAEQAPEDVAPEVKMEVDASAVIVPPSPATSTEQEMQDQQDAKPSLDLTTSADGAPATPAKDAMAKKEAPPSVAGTEKSEQKPGETSTKKKRRAREEEQDDWDEEWAKFDYASLPHGAKPEQYTVEECRKIEKYYWRNFTFGAPPMYGADGSGSLFDESNKEWNVAALDDLLMRINPHMPMPGVNTPYLYFGMWRATFSWHVEDADLYSINHLHFGAPKFWYSVPQAHAERFERVMASYFQRDRQKCPEFLRHKSYLVSPQKLAKDGIPLNRVVQFPGEIVLTYPYGYHSGFNIGFNCAESINFATEGWLDIGRKAEACVCVPDSVRIDVDKWLEEAREDAERIRSDPVYAEQRKQERELAVIIPQHEAKRRRIMGPDYVERKPRTVAQPRMQPKPAPAAKPAKVFKDENEMPKTVSQMNSQQLPPHKQQQQPQQQQKAPGPTYAQMQAQIQANAKKPPAQAFTQLNKPAPVHSQLKIMESIANRTPVPQPEASSFPCALCPEHSTEGLVRIANPGYKNKNKVLHAHKICVTFTPTTWVAPDPQTGEELVYGFELIEKERWNLKCGLCTERHGTKIQCTKTAKCVRAFHTTCAIKEDSGIILDALIGGRSVLNPQSSQQQGQTDATDDGHLQLVVACRQHNPAWMKAQAEKRKNDLSKRVSALPIGDQIQIRSTTGIYRVSVLGHRPEIQAVEIAFGDGTRALCKHGAIVWPEDAAKIQAEQAKAAALPASVPRMHPMERSRSGQTTNGALPVAQAGHPYSQPMHHIHPVYQHQHQQHQQHQTLPQTQAQYYPQTSHGAIPQQYSVQAQYHSQYQMPQPPIHYQQQYMQHQQPQYVQAQMQGRAISPQQQYQQSNFKQSQESVGQAQAPSGVPLGFVPQPIPYFNGKPVPIKTQAQFPPANTC